MKFRKNPTCNFKAPKPPIFKKFVAPPQPCAERMRYIPGLKLKMGMEADDGSIPPPLPPIPPPAVFFDLLMESGDYLLLENGNKIRLEQSNG